ncbi:MAG: 50S ribosomal protein L10 [Patescibacteria group bacterium]|nr:50S ribosomal protein L10 [Patescibacteria group bacterium]
MPKTRQQKEVAINDLVKEFKEAKSVVFADYQGLTVAKADELRNKARESGVRYMVAKKTLLSKAAKLAGFDLDTSKLTGMLGAAFGKEDEVAPAKVLGDMTKDTPIKLVGGIFEGQVVGADKAIALSKLPSKQQLLGQLVGTMYAPVSAFVRALNAIRESMEKGSPVVTETVVSEEKAEEPKAEEPKAEEKPVEPTADAVPTETSEAPATDAPAAA